MAESILDKYVGHYFEHYLICTSYEMTDKGYYELANRYLQIEGIDEFRNLIDEISRIEEANDWDAFVLYLKTHEPDVDRATIQRIASIAGKVFGAKSESSAGSL